MTLERNRTKVMTSLANIKCHLEAHFTINTQIYFPIIKIEWIPKMKLLEISTFHNYRLDKMIPEVHFAMTGHLLNLTHPHPAIRFLDLYGLARESLIGSPK
jgi:hypothetical protein